MRIELLKELSDFEAISSFEQSIGDFIISKLDQDIIVQKDGLLSVIAQRKEKNDRVRLMVATHIDEVGFMVKTISDDGYIHMQNVGSLWSHLIAGQKMRVITKEGKKYCGIIGSYPTHGIPKVLKEKTMNLDDLYLDMGVSSKSSLEKLGIAIGDMIVPDTYFEALNEEGYYVGKALDNRVSDFILMELLAKDYHNNLIGAFTSQEEVGLRGARSSTHIIRPDIAFAIDTTLAGDTPLTKNICKLGSGVVLSMIDSNSIAPRKLVRYLEEICIQEKIPYQFAVFNGGGTDSGNIHKSFDGILNMTLSIPIRYMHSCYSIIHSRDVQACIDLIQCVLNDLTIEKLEELQ